MKRTKNLHCTVLYLATMYFTGTIQCCTALHCTQMQFSVLSKIVICHATIYSLQSFFVVLIFCLLQAHGFPCRWHPAACHGGLHRRPSTILKSSVLDRITPGKRLVYGSSAIKKRAQGNRVFGSRQSIEINDAEGRHRRRNRTFGCSCHANDAAGP